MFKLIASALAVSAVLLLFSAPITAGADPISASPVIVQHVGDIRPVAAADGMVHLVYELLVINQSAFAVTLDEITAVNAESGAVLKTLAGDQLVAATRLALLGGDGTILEPSQSSFVFMDAVVSRGATPATLLNRITATKTELDEGTGNYGGLTIEPEAGENPTVTFETAAVDVGPPAVVLSALVHGDNWIIFRGCCDLATSHRGGTNAYNGVIQVPERFGFDLVRLNEDRMMITGPGNLVESYVHYGEPVYAVADGTIVSARNDQPTQAPGTLPNGIDEAQAGGNAVVIDIGAGAFAFYSHMQIGTVTVKAGDHVRAGDQIGLIGNSGKSIGPHLHFHVSTSPGIGGDGLPFVFENFNGSGALSGDALMMAMQGQPADILPDLYAGPHNAEMPLNNQVVDFGGE
jgi:hypothetical protein